MKTKEEILEEFNTTSNSDELAFWKLLLELLADIRDDQIAHNNEMETLLKRPQSYGWH